MRRLALLYLLVHLIVVGISRKVVDVLQTVKFGNCDEAHENKTNYSYFTNISITNVGRGRTVINGQFVSMYSVRKTTAINQMFNCHSTVETDCELFGSYNHKDFCATTLEPGRIYSGIYLAFHPPITCPLKKSTVHQITNATVDADVAIKLGKIIPGVRNYYWLTRTRMFALPGHTEFGCMKMMIKMSQIRV